MGTADGRILSFDPSGEAHHVAGQGHTNLVSDLKAHKDKVFSVGYDDRVREISSKEFTYVEEERHLSLPTYLISGLPLSLPLPSLKQLPLQVMRLFSS